jgi:RimJ/RimL family protein N-acetyltransferase
MILTLDRLVLREFVTRDWEAVHEYAADGHVVRHLFWGPNQEHETRTFLQRAIGFQHDRHRRDFELAITLKDDQTLIGGCGLHLSLPENPDPAASLAPGCAWIGYVLNRKFWGHGYATEAATALLDLGFGELGLHRVYATCDPANVASRRVLEKIGMRAEGHLREHRLVKDRWRDSLLYAAVAGDRTAFPTPARAGLPPT